MTLKDKTVSPNDRYAPCVFSRLMDDEPEKTTETYARGITVKVLFNEILRNIRMILNAKSHASNEQLNNDPEIIDSVLGMGLPDFCGNSQSAAEREKLRLQLIHQLQVFEPRLKPDTIQVDYISSEKGHSLPGTLEFEIHAQVHVDPLDEAFVFRSTLDLEAGKTTITAGDLSI